ncbi:MAG: rhodanese-like domain-containing protein [Rhodospirillaceae bacterium]|jgi:rhodanese-related sulfurtransferase|nr:rhodanese-like domain-containing protein [Rhodospirillaceae bacterium]MBT5667522.1 rhodanese-like domain-containing protein [Rhodospirillaceae bacterium]MBT5811474.1 rhodanese-like domain-containing protein [Rhodospirillaceae bacterium]
MITKGYKKLLEEAEAVIETLTVEDAKSLHGGENVTFVDIRDVREVKREGKVSGALHAPRGMLEFWIDPESPYHRDVFATGNKFVLYCASGWRSALAAKALQEMGFGPVAHIGGGFTAWNEAEGPVDAPE